jgi:3-oxoacyl-[acyl-carrier protein] reductase
VKLLNERVAVVTGSTKGNGRAIANIYSEQGANVVVTGRNQVEAQNVAEELSKEYGTDPLGLKIDVTSAAEIKNMIDKTLTKYGKIDVLVNNAGYPILDDVWDVSFDQISDEILERVLDIDTQGTYRCCREVLPLMVERRRGVIINISSTLAISG